MVASRVIKTFVALANTWHDSSWQPLQKHLHTENEQMGLASIIMEGPCCSKLQQLEQERNTKIKIKLMSVVGKSICVLIVYLLYFYVHILQVLLTVLL